MYKKENLYFIALIPKRDLREKINVFKNDFANRFDSKKALKVYPHITLKAPFKLSSNTHTALVNWFSELRINQKSISLHLKNFGAFPNKNNPVIYVNPIVNNELQFMQKEIIASCSSFLSEDIHSVDIKFKPHITVADMFSKAWQEYRNKSFDAEFEVDAFYLLQHDTKKWSIISTYNLLQEVTAVKLNINLANSEKIF
jgi:2'-5' RNA ligase